MREDALGTIEGLTTALGLQDLDAALAYFAETAVYVVHADEAASGASGEYRGHGEIRMLLGAFAEEWELVSWRCGTWLQRDGAWSGRMETKALHRASGLDFTETRRRVYRLDGRRVVRCDETLDSARLRAFLGYARWTARCPASEGRSSITT